MWRAAWEYGETCCAVSSHSLRRVDFHFCLLQLGRLQLTKVCCNWRSVWTPLLPSTTLSQVMSPTTTTSWRLPNHPGILRRERVPEWPRVRWHHRHGALFTTVHSGVILWCDRRAYHSNDEGLSSSQSSSSVGHRTGRPVKEQFDSRISNVSENPRLSWGILLERQREQIPVTVKQRFENANSRPIMTEEGFKSWMKWSSLIVRRIRRTGKWEWTQLSESPIHHGVTCVPCLCYIALVRRICSTWSTVSLVIHWCRMTMGSR